MPFGAIGLKILFVGMTFYDIILGHLKIQRGNLMSKIEFKGSVITSYSIHYTKLYDDILSDVKTEYSMFARGAFWLRGSLPTLWT